MSWPTFSQARAIAKRASAAGFTLRMETNGREWFWTWNHTPSGMLFPGTCHNEHKAIALVCALMVVPLVAK